MFSQQQRRKVTRRTKHSSVTDAITWQNTEQYLRDFRAFLRELQDMLDRLIQRLRNAGLVNAEESAGLRPTLQVTI